jgi:hypothetical protein
LNVWSGARGEKWREGEGGGEGRGRQRDLPTAADTRHTDFQKNQEKS